LNVIASLAIKAAYLELLPDFERQSGNKVDTQWVGMADIRKRMLAGETTDAVIGSAALIEDLARIGSLDSRSRVDLVKSGVGAAVRAGAAKPDLRSVEALKAALRAAKSIVYSSGPSGVYLAELFQRLGIDQELKAKATQAPPGVLVGELVAHGQFELCFQQIPELRQVCGIDYVGPLPGEVQLLTVFSGGVHSKSSQAKAAAEWLRYLASRDAEPVIRKHGLEPA
jgi:molybdate transport system substrate-binding protein